MDMTKAMQALRNANAAADRGEPGAADDARRIAQMIKQAQGPQAAKQGQPETVKIDRSGVKDYGLRANLARAENSDEYKLRLGEAGFSEDMYFQDPATGEFVLRLDNIPQDLKKEYGLKGTGNLAIEDEEMFTKQDIAEFFSANSGPIIGGTLAAIVTGGVGLIPAAIAAGAGSAGGYLLEEGMEYAGGVQAQDLGSVGRTAAYEAVAGALGEGIGRGVAAVGGRLIKGPGGDAANEARALARTAIEQGARPTVRAATTSPVLGRLQAIYEGVFPNQNAAKRNAEAVLKQVRKIRTEQGIETPVDYDAIRDALQRDITRIYGTPEQLIKDANRNLDGIVAQEIDKVKAYFGNPDPRGARSVAQSLQIAKQTFDEDVASLYSKADLLLGKTPIVNTGGIKATLQSIIEDNPALNLQETVFGKFVMNMDDTVNVQTANSLRTVLNQASFDPSLVGAADKAMLTRLNNSVQNAFMNSEASLAAVLAGNAPARTAGGQFVSLKNMATAREGLKTLREAQRFYSKGVDRFQSAKASKLYQLYKTGEDFDPQLLIDPEFGLLVPNKGERMRRFLNAVVPSGRPAAAVPQSITDVVPDTPITLPNGQTQSLREAVRFLPADDPLRRHYEEVFQNQRRFSQRVAAARQDGVAAREAVRRQIAGDYLSKMFDQQRNLLGRLDPAKVAEEIRKLGSTGRVLFGTGRNGQYETVMKSLRDMASLGRAVTDDDLAQLAGRPITDQVEAIRALTKAKEDLTGTQLVRTLERAADEGNPEAILNAVFRRNEPGAVKAAKNILGDTSETMEAVRDLGLRRILASAGDPDMMSGDDFIKAVFDGRHADKLKASLNSYGRETLEALFGKDTTDGLYALSNFSNIASQAPIKGLGALAPATIAQSLGIVGFLTAPGITLSTFAGLYTMSRLLRQKWFLKLLTRPTGVRPGKGLPYDEIGRIIEQAYEISGQVGAALPAQAERERAIRQPTVTPPQAPEPPQVRGELRDVAPPAEAPAPAPRPAPARTPSPNLLGADPATQQRNLEIMQRLMQQRQ